MNDNGMECKRCGTDEDRMDGYCSVECEGTHCLENDIKKLEAEVKRLRGALEDVAYASEGTNDMYKTAIDALNYSRPALP